MSHPLSSSGLERKTDNWSQPAFLLFSQTSYPVQISSLGEKKKDSEKEVRGSRRRLGGEQEGPFGLSLSPVKWA